MLLVVSRASTIATSRWNRTLQPKVAFTIHDGGAHVSDVPTPLSAAHRELLRPSVQTNTATFHSLHHTRSRGNFGLHTRLWDRLFGTEIADYERVFVERGGAEVSLAHRKETS